MGQLASKWAYSFLNIFTITNSINYFYSTHCKHPVHQFVYVLYQFWGQFCIIRLLLSYYHIKYNNFAFFERYEPWGMRIGIITGNKFIYISFSCYLVHTINCFYYSSKVLFKVMDNSMRDLIIINNAL